MNLSRDVTHRSLPPTPPLPSAERKLRRVYTIVGAMAASLLAIAAAFAFLARSPSETFRIVDARNCQWASSTIPITENSPLTPGRLSLVSGIAVLQLPNVNISIEGGCDIEIIDSQHCHLYRGRAFTEVSPGGEGFVIETPTSVLTDRGTAFTVNVSDTGQTDVKVVKGLVEVQNRETGKNTSLTTNEQVRTTKRDLQPLDRSESQSTSERPLAIHQNSVQAFKQLQISTAVGDGKDGYVIRGKEKQETNTEGLLLVKATNDSPWQAPWRRRAFLHFDLSSLTRKEILSATLHLQGATTDIGFLSRTPDTTFAVYGLTDESQDNWSELSLTWKNCPGFLPDHENVDPSCTKLLGRFTVSSSNVSDHFTIDGQALADFLAADNTHGVTIFVVSETVGPDESWCHGFASRRHPFLTPPTLRLRIPTEATVPSE